MGWSQDKESFSDFVTCKAGLGQHPWHLFEAEGLPVSRSKF